MSTETTKPAKTSLSIGAQFIAAAAVWGASFLFIKVAVEGISPAQVVLGRLMGGAVLLVLVMVLTRRKWPTGMRTWLHLFAIGILMCVAPFLLFSWAAQYLPSGLSSIFNATTPIATMIIALAVLPEERLTRIKTTAMLIAAGGIVLVLGPWRLLTDLQDANLIAQLACLGGTTCYGLGFTYTRRFFRSHTYDATTVAASQIGAGALVIAVLTPFIGLDPVSLSPAIIASILLLGAVGTGVAYIWYTNVINAWGATVASTVTYLTPIGGVILGILVLHESIHWNEVMGGIIVILAVLVSQGRLTLPVASLSLRRMRKLQAHPDLEGHHGRLR
ncbi:DMT family transporter [Arthrobacter sp. ISL-95]|uniref:DMT family transporter n=1 Tax=Arthrobacter sp. ISL-95 TaxID=2819116 RepID=UPI001BE9F837|nr:DMT family transporter [Arthrobacter sp. ISL-95]MBT2588393.1 DMT family transporter [Arthrobacter sp. ISL-95]